MLLPIRTNRIFLYIEKKNLPAINSTFQFVQFLAPPISVNIYQTLLNLCPALEKVSKLPDLLIFLKKWR